MHEIVAASENVTLLLKLLGRVFSGSNVFIKVPPS